MGEIQTQGDLARKKVDLRKVTLLIVDSNEFSRSFTRSICRNVHFGDILIASNTTDALEMLRTRAIGLVLCDWVLSPMSSIEFIKKIRWEQEKWVTSSMVPIIMLTAVSSAEAFIGSRDAGVNDYLAKPLVMRRFLDSVGMVLSMQRPYVKSATYIGPCRRRKQVAFSGPERRAGWQTKAQEAPKPVEKVDLGQSMEEMEKAGEAVIAQEAENYSKVRLDDIAELFNLVRLLKQPDEPIKEVLDRIYIKAHDVKGMGDTFGFPLLTKVGELLCSFVKGADPESFKTLSRLQAVETHVIVMKMIVDSNMHDEGDELATEVMEELQMMVRKFNSP